MGGIQFQPRYKAQGLHLAGNELSTDSESDLDTTAGDGEDDGACVVSEETQELRSAY